MPSCIDLRPETSRQRDLDHTTQCKKYSALYNRDTAPGTIQLQIPTVDQDSLAWMKRPCNYQLGLQKGSANCQQQSLKVVKSYGSSCSAASGACSYRKLSTEAGHAAAASQRGDHQVVHQVQVPVRVHLDEEKLLKDSNPISAGQRITKKPGQVLARALVLKNALDLGLSVVLYSDYWASALDS